MRQKYTVTVADVSMNIVCDESQETVNEAVTALDAQMRSLGAASSNCTKTEAALLCALDHITQCQHLKQRVKELEATGAAPQYDGNNSFESGVLRGENEALRSELQVCRGEYEALLQDNAMLFSLNAKLAKQNAEANTRADRMHDQVLSILIELNALREKLASMGVATREPSASYHAREAEPAIEVTPAEQQTTRKYEQLDVEGILQTAAPNGDATRRASSMFEMLDFDNGNQ